MSRSYNPRNKPLEIRATLPAFTLPDFRFTEAQAIRMERKADEEKIFNDPVDWIEHHFYDHSTVNKINWDFSIAEKVRLQDFQKRILRHVLTPDKQGIFPYSTVIYSAIKKSGKTATAAAVAAWFAAQVEAPNLVLILANNQEQSAGLIFESLEPTLHAMGSHGRIAKNSKPEIRIANGTIVRAIPNNYAGQAGANYGLTLWSELWTFTSEREQRLYEELIPVLTRKNSMRWIETYAGYEDESKLLLDLFLKVFKDTSEQEIQVGARPVRGLEDITTGEGSAKRPACWEVPSEGVFMFWDRERRMTWQKGAKADREYNQLKKTLRPSAYIRLCENRWQKSESKFIPEDWYARSLTLGDKAPEYAPQMYVAVDASQRHDTTSIVGVIKVEETMLDAATGKQKQVTRFKTVYCKVYDPHGVDIDLEETVAADIKNLYEQGLIKTIYKQKGASGDLEPELQLFYDPFQMHTVAMNLRKQNINAQEFQQGKEREKADTFLWKVYRDGLIDNFDHADLKAHVSAAKAVEKENEVLRIVKGTQSNAGKIDACVAQSMAVYKASIAKDFDTGGDWSALGQGVAGIYTGEDNDSDEESE